MDRDEVRVLLERVARGDLPTDDALDTLVSGPLALDHGRPAGFADLGFARLDTHRALRTGDPEVIYGAGKTPTEVVSLLRALHEQAGDRPAVATRLSDEAMATVRDELPQATVDELARCARLGELPATRGTVCIVTAGTSDAPVAAEAAFVARAFGAEVTRVTDVGVAGIHRLLAVRPELERADCLVVVAGMEGALPSAVGGLVGVPIVAVPTSVGYGAAFEGLAALLGMLTSCAPGVTVVNIDNGFGAGLFAARVAPQDRAGRDVIGWWHCSAGASGDMVLGALVDAGVALATMQAAVDALGTEPITLLSSPVKRHGIAATLVMVDAPQTPTDRSWAGIRALLEGAQLDPAVRALAVAGFGRLAAAEAAVHRVPVDEVHFHEVGGLDAIADIVGAAAGLVALDLDRIQASPVVLGSGTALGEHGAVPVPGPAVLALLSAAEAPVEAGPAPYEMCTPTGAALLATTVSSWGQLPPMRVVRVGTGAGGRDPVEVANVLRLVIGEPLEAPAQGGPELATELVIECNVDDLDPRLWPAVLSRLLEAGAADAWLTPILMKKGRPAHALSVLVGPDHAEAVRTVMFTETSTLGLRETPYTKRALVRELVTVTVDGLPVTVKVGLLDGVVVNAQPEYEDVVAAAAKLGRPVKAVLAAANAAAHEAGLTP